MKWYMRDGNNSDVVVSTRVRLARNIDEIPFPRKLDAESGKKVLILVKKSLEENFSDRLNFIETTKKSPIDLQVMLEDHLISNEFCESAIYPKMLITNEENNLSIMVNEEDHMRIQAIYSGFALEEAFKLANSVDDAISKGVRYAFNDKLGFLTSCPTNLGTGLRASVMMHLPAICMTGYIKNLFALMTKIGLTVRGLYGEGTEAKGHLFQISNQITLGISEKDTLAKLNAAVNQIIAKERELRKNLSSEENIDFIDNLSRSLGILKTAIKISADEATSLISKIRLAGYCGIIKNVNGQNLIKLLIEIMPAHIVSFDEKAKDSTLTRDKIRAEYIKKQLEEIII